MQITKAEVIPGEVRLQQYVRMAHLPEIKHVTAVFVRLETVDGKSAWGCGVAHPDLTGEDPESFQLACQDCAALAPDLPPINLEYSLTELSKVAQDSPGARCAFDLALYDLLGQATSMPVHRLLGGFRQSIQTSVTIPIADVTTSVELANRRASQGFRMLKVKGGLDPQEDVRRMQAIHRSLPNLILRLDADGGYSVLAALDVARALEGQLEMLEQPVPADDLDGLQQVTLHSPVAVLADQSVSDPASALKLAASRLVDGLSIKVATCGGLRCATQADTIARAAGLVTMVSCVIEPALLISAGLSLALSSPNVRYCDLDGHLDLDDDPSVPGFTLQEGWLVAGDAPGLGCQVDLA